MKSAIGLYSVLLIVTGKLVLDVCLQWLVVKQALICVFVCCYVWSTLYCDMFSLTCVILSD